MDRDCVCLRTQREHQGCRGRFQRSEAALGDVSVPLECGEPALRCSNFLIPVASTGASGTCAAGLERGRASLTRQQDYVSLNQNNQLEAFPNPVQDVLNIRVSGNEKVSEIRLFDVNGRMVMNKKTSATTAQLNVASLNSGIYLIKVMSGDKVISSKKIVKR